MLSRNAVDSQHSVAVVVRAKFLKLGSSGTVFYTLAYICQDSLPDGQTWYHTRLPRGAPASQIFPQIYPLEPQIRARATCSLVWTLPPARRTRAQLATYLPSPATSSRAMQFRLTGRHLPLLAGRCCNWYHVLLLGALGQARLGSVEVLCLPRKCPVPLINKAAVVAERL